MILIFNNTFTYAQRDPAKNPNYGPDSVSRIACANDLSTMSEYVKINLYEEALPAWRNVFNNCPASSKNIYINGVKIFQDKIEKSKNPVLISAYFDTLMLIYDRRIENFGEEGYVLGRKGKDILKYNSQNYKDAYMALKSSVSNSGNESDIGVTVGLIETGVLMFNNGNIPAKELLNNYLLVSGIYENQLNNGGRAEILEQANTRINDALGKASLNNCSEIEEAFRDKIESESKDIINLKLISNLLAKSACDLSDFFGLVNEKVFSLEPSADNAYTLAWYYIKTEKFGQSVTYLKKAIELEPDPEKKAHYYYQLALISSTKIDNQQDAAAYGVEALKLKSDWGDPYFVIANAYILGSKSCFESAFERSAVYWVASDLCAKAKAADPSVAERANSLIEDYSRFYPNNEEIFFRSLQEGGEYRIGCWINEKTTVRIRK